MVQNTLLLSTCAAICLLVYPLFASGPGEKINLEDKKTIPIRERSSTLPSRLLSSPPSPSEKGILSRLSAKVNSKKKSDERTSSAPSPDFLKELKQRQAAREKQATVQEQKEESKRKSEEHTHAPPSPTQQTIVQKQNQEFPPKELLSGQIQFMMKASFLLMLAEISNESKEEALTKHSTLAELNNGTQACFQTSLARFTGLLVAAQENYINSLQESPQKAKEAAFTSLKAIYKGKEKDDSHHPLEIYKDCIVDSRITAVRSIPITVEDSKVLYSYQFMVGDQKLSLPYLDDGKLTLLDGKVNFSFIKQSRE